MSGDKPPAIAALAEAPLQSGRLVENILHFARTLRAAGLPVGPGKVLQAIRAVEVAGIQRREDFYWALHAVLVNRRDQREIFDQAFHVFWRNPKILEKMMSLLLPDVRPSATGSPEEELELSRRVAEALTPIAQGREPSGEGEQEQIEVDATMTWSGREVLQKMDFEKMSAEELSAAKTAISRLRFSLQQVPTRRFVSHPRGRRADLRRTLRAALRSGSDSIPLKWRRRRRRHPPLVVLCDISGSMDRYSRMALHFMHAVTNDRDRVHTFLFGTRLSNITRFLRHKDVDVALKLVSEHVLDWSGGTRIGACLHDFNKTWARRVLGQGAILLFISDGLDRDNAEGLAGEMERLHKSCRRLIWLNPLLRYEGYEPRSLGARAIMPHVDEFRPVYNLDSLAELAEVLSRPITRREEGVSEWLDSIP
ncbi:MAG: VWA domain-containing protein [Kiloniellales bacterium]|nr:VWA domain-containing protein [Kiloniellales bacterium]